METIGDGQSLDLGIYPENSGRAQEQRDPEDRVEAVDLLEEFWFFGNSLHRKKNTEIMMKRCFSDPSSSSSTNQEMLSSFKVSEKKGTSFPSMEMTQGQDHCDDSVSRKPEEKSSSEKLLKGPEGIVSPSVVDTPQEKSMKQIDRIGNSASKKLLQRSDSIKNRSSKVTKGGREGAGTNDANRNDSSGEDYPSMDQIYQLMLSKNDSDSAPKNSVPRSDSIRNRSSKVTKDGRNGAGPDANVGNESPGEDEYPSMDQIHQLMLGSSSASTKQVQDDESSARGRSNGSGSGSVRMNSSRPSLVRAPSLPVLARAPSLAPLGLEEKESHCHSHPRMIKSNRQSSLNLSDFLPPRHSAKGTSSYLSTDKEMKRRILSRTKSMKSRGDLESEEVQGFKDLGFTFDKKDLNPNLVNILPGLQEKDKEAEEEEEEEEGKEVKGPYLSEAWLSQSFAPPIPKWTPKGGSTEDMKAHIKFWARAVASNVDQEC